MLRNLYENTKICKIVEAVFDMGYIKGHIIDILNETSQSLRIHYIYFYQSQKSMPPFDCARINFNEYPVSGIIHIKLKK